MLQKIILTENSNWENKLCLEHLKTVFIGIVYAFDFDKTEAALWGSVFCRETEICYVVYYSYYIGIGVGGTGQCEEEDGVITVKVEPYEAHGLEQAKQRVANEKSRYRYDEDELNRKRTWNDKTGGYRNNPYLQGQEHLKTVSARVSIEAHTKRV